MRTKRCCGRHSSGRTPTSNGVIVGPLLEVDADRIVIAGEAVYLRPGMICDYGPGTVVRVTYVERGGRLEVTGITRADTFR